MNITIKDVAKLAKVSPSTVSRAIANNPRISDETKQRVHEAMEKLKYRPNAIARSLANRKTNILGIIIPNSDENLFKNPFFINVLRGISIYSQKNGYHIMYTYSKNEEEELKFLKEYIYSNIVDGIILLTTVENDQLIQYLKEENFPFSVIGRPELSDGVLWVDNDNFKAMYNVVNYLISQGYSKIGFVGGPQKFVFSNDRLEGYRMAIGARGYQIEDKLIVHTDGFDMNSGYLACEKIFENSSPAAIATTDDLLAFGVRKYLDEKGLKDVKVTGFNNIPVNEFQKPSIMSVDINSEGLGYSVAKLLISKLNDKKLVNNHLIVETKLIERD